MNEEKKGLLKGTFIYMIGNVAVALLQLIMLRFITGNVNTDGYGYYDTIVKIDNLITPVLTLQISDAVFRNVIRGDEKEKRLSVTNGTTIIVSGIIITALGLFAANLLFYDLPHCCLVILYIISTNVFSFYQKLARAVGANLSYVKSNLLKAFLYLFLQIILISCFRMKEESLFIATTLSTVICLIYLEKNIKAIRFISPKEIDLTYMKSMLKYSIPLVPNTMLWWFSSSVNSLWIPAKIGFNANGIFSVASKFSSVIAIAASVFNLAWQESAIKEYGSERGKAFFHEVYIMFYRIICCAVMLCIPLMRIILPNMIDPSYYEAINYAPLLVIGAGLSSTYGFFGQMYSATGKTKGAAVTTVWGVITNLTIIFFLTKYMNLWAPTLATVCSAFTIMIMRYFQFKNDMQLTITKDLVVLLFLIILSLPVYYYGNIIICLIYIVIGIIVSFYVNKKFLADMLNIVSERMKR